jgi:hypothetical protein
MGGIIPCELEGRPVLGFDTGLNAKAFAQTKSAQLMTLPGWMVSPEGRVDPWNLEGVIEKEGTMVIWGAAFAGERLDRLISDSARKDEALDALRYWTRGRIILLEAAGNLAPAPWPAGALIDSQGTILFPPDQLIKRTIEAEGSEAWRAAAVCWVHPDLTGDEAPVFAAGTMLYRIFYGSPPFPNQDMDLLRQDIREGVFFPLRLAAPGLEPRLASLITGAMESFTRSKAAGSPTSLEILRDYLGSPGSAKVDDYIHSLGEEAWVKINLEQKRFRKRQGLTLKTKRFVLRNTALLAAILAAIAVIGLVGRSISKGRSALPTTKGMSPLEVVETYYNAIGALDHTVMDACVIHNAGKEDINLVTHYFVISKVQQAYQMDLPGILPAQQWIDSGAGPTKAAVFGVSGLRLERLDRDEQEEEVSFKASYMLWLPKPADDPDTGSASISRTDTLRLVRYKDAWRIAEIRRY